MTKVEKKYVSSLEKKNNKLKYEVSHIRNNYDACKKENKELKAHIKQLLKDLKKK